MWRLLSAFGASWSFIELSLPATNGPERERVCWSACVVCVLQICFATQPGGVGLPVNTFTVGCEARLCWLEWRLDALLQNYVESWLLSYALLSGPPFR